MRLEKGNGLNGLSDELVAKAKRVALRRTAENKAKAWYKDTKKSYEPQEAIESRGIQCELALAQHLQLALDPIFQTGNRSAVKGTDMGDMIYDGVHIDVKGVKTPYSHLLVSKTKRLTCIDVFVLVYHDSVWGHFRFLGAIPYHKAFGKKIVLSDGTDLGNGVHQSDLLDLHVAIAEAKAEREKERQSILNA